MIQAQATPTTRCTPWRQSPLEPALSGTRTVSARGRSCPTWSRCSTNRRPRASICACDGTLRLATPCRSTGRPLPSCSTRFTQFCRGTSCVVGTMGCGAHGLRGTGNYANGRLIWYTQEGNGLATYTGEKNFRNKHLPLPYPGSGARQTKAPSSTSAHVPSARSWDQAGAGREYLD